MPACRLDRQCFESRRKGAVCQNRPIKEQQMLIWPQIGASLPLGLVVNCGKWAASRLMSSERIIGEFYAALPLGSGGKPHNARRDSIDDTWQLRRPPDVELRPSVQATSAECRGGDQEQKPSGRS